ncbi:hypothetical protein BN2476_70002 [Paraburkholderia piptadeniae]|uniref:Uncharacterized protein n=1 Tax=Paraburkholderia piptadeniae TaxID=1701573 RepID=A0A1N7RL19_9BURK|nr:hypothetical protein BN2476_70002 [Paraburkholderia piptadeniae]
MLQAHLIKANSKDYVIVGVAATTGGGFRVWPFCALARPKVDAAELKWLRQWTEAGAFSGSLLLFDNAKAGDETNRSCQTFGEITSTRHTDNDEILETSGGCISNCVGIVWCGTRAGSSRRQLDAFVRHGNATGGRHAERPDHGRHADRRRPARIPEQHAVQARDHDERAERGYRGVVDCRFEWRDQGAG